MARQECLQIGYQAHASIAKLRAVASNDPAPILSNPTETLESHLIVFAAERSRREGRVVHIWR